MIDFACKKFELDEIFRCSLNLTKSEFRIFYFLMKNRKEYQSKDIAKSLGLDLSTVQRALKKIYGKNVLIRSQRNLESGYVFLYKIKNIEEVRENILSTIHSWTKRVEEEVSSL